MAPPPPPPRSEDEPLRISQGQQTVQHAAKFGESRELTRDAVGFAAGRRFRRHPGCLARRAIMIDPDNSAASRGLNESVDESVGRASNQSPRNRLAKISAEAIRAGRRRLSGNPRSIQRGFEATRFGRG